MRGSTAFQESFPVPPVSQTELLKRLAFASRDEVMAVLQYVVNENEVLRSSHPRRVPTTQADRWRLERFARAVPRHFDDVIRIASPRTVRYWTRPRKHQKKRSGRPTTVAELRTLIIRMAEENGWGVVRIHGELTKLGLGRRASVNTIRRILRELGVPPGGSGMERWKEFRKRHPDALWSCDFLAVPVDNATGRFWAYLLAWVHIPSRRIYLSFPTRHPTKDWTAQQGRNWMMWAEDQGFPGKAIILDRDCKYGSVFRSVVESHDWEYWRIPARQPQCNGYAESFIGSFKRECLDRLVFESLDEVAAAAEAFRTFYHEERPHRGLDNRPPLSADRSPIGAPSAFAANDITCATSCHGLLRSYHWRQEAA